MGQCVMTEHGPEACLLIDISTIEEPMHHKRVLELLDEIAESKVCCGSISSRIGSIKLSSSCPDCHLPLNSHKNLSPWDKIVSQRLMVDHDLPKAGMQEPATSCALTASTAPFKDVETAHLLSRLLKDTESSSSSDREVLDAIESLRLEFLSQMRSLREPAEPDKKGCQEEKVSSTLLARTKSSPPHPLSKHKTRLRNLFRGNRYSDDNLRPLIMKILNSLENIAEYLNLQVDGGGNGGQTLSQAEQSTDEMLRLLTEGSYP